MRDPDCGFCSYRAGWNSPEGFVFGHGEEATFFNAFGDEIHIGKATVHRFALHRDRRLDGVEVEASLSLSIDLKLPLDACKQLFLGLVVFWHVRLHLGVPYHREPKGNPKEENSQLYKCRQCIHERCILIPPAYFPSLLSFGT